MPTKTAKKPTKSRKKKVETLTAIHILLDRSGSMGGSRESTCKGMNKFIDDQRKVEGKALLSLTQFDDQYEPNYLNVPLEEAEYLTFDTYQPRGMTALNDAIARSIADFSTDLKKLDNKPDQVLFVIITDDLENASKEFPGHEGRKRVYALMEQMKNEHKWQFVFIGATVDAAKSAQGYGVSSSHTVRSTNSAKGMSASFHAVSLSTTAYRGSGAQSYAADQSFLTDEAKAMVDAVVEEEEGTS